MIYYAKANKAEEGGYWIVFDDLAGCYTEGDTLEEALFMAEEALNLYLSCASAIKAPNNYEGRQDYYAVKVYPHIATALKLRFMREALGLTQGDVAGRLNITYQAYQRLENPAKNNITIKTIDKIQRALGIELVAI
ncbi:MAG: type II toxin-antitoxin system HicB family antitoxin [Spirochaetaceae bacterium]|nr:type II toxin-antitoxin system HicB family antitoxin [Spirochaetaceae bacterium]